MQRVLQASCGFLGLASMILLIGGPDLPAQIPGKLPQVDKATHQGYTETVKGINRESKEAMAAKCEMVPIPGGVFLMGSPDGEAGRKDDEGPQHPVQVKPFWMGKTEVSWDEFDIYWKEKGADNADDNDKILKANKDAITGPTPTYVDADYGHGHAGHPMICLSHHCAVEYCRWLSSKTGKTYRLPTEAEWEWAARAGTTTAYFFGNDPKDLADYSWYVKNAAPNADEDPQTHKVGTRKANPWGLHDMYGNVTEWCVDHYQKDYYASFKGQLAISPVIVPTEKRWSHVVRGGSWSDPAERCRSAARRGSDISWVKDDPQRPRSIWWLTKMDVVGFRVVRALEEQENLKGLKSKITRESD